MAPKRTYCPHCKAIDFYEWQLIDIPSAARNQISDSLQMAEIYCNKCHTTLLLTPVPAKS